MDFRPAGMSDEEETDYNGAINYSKNASARNINGPKVNGQMNEVEERKLFHKLAREACDSENVYMIDKFVNADNDVNAFLDSGWTLLLYASSAARPTMIKHLLGLGADPNKDKDGHTPLLALCNTIRNTPAQRLESLILLLEAGADSNFISRMKETPLMHACNSQEADFIAELVKSVNNINALDIEKRSALFYATIINRSDSVKVLLENGIDINQKDSRGMTCKDVAIAKGYEEIVAVLDECKPDEEEIVSFGTTKILSWRDLFSSLRHRDDVNIDIDILSILNGIGLEKISALFCGMQLKDFLRLTEEDLEKIGVDIGIHRQRFVEDIFKFHNQVWCIDTLGSYVDKRKSYTICSTIKSLGIVSKHVDVIAAGLCHVKSCLALREINKDLIITEESKVEYATEFHKLRYNLQKLKKELRILKKLTEQINKNNEITNPLYIGPETPTKKYRWGTAISVALIGGFCMSKFYLRII